MAQRTIDRVDGLYQRARTDYVNDIAALASRSQNIPYLYKSRVLEHLRSLLSDVVPSIQNTAAIALGRIANRDEKIAEEIIKNEFLVPLLSKFNSKSKIYKRSALYLIRSISRHSSDLAQAITNSGGLEAVVLCLEDFDPKVREASCWAVEYISRHSPVLAEIVVDSGVLPMLVVCLQEVEVSLKQAASAAISSIARHSLELAQAAADAEAIPYLVRCIKNPDTKLKRQVYLALSNISTHNLELATFVVEAEIFPEVLIQTAHTDEIVKRHAAILVREVVKHSVEMAEYVANCGGIAALINMLENTEGATRLPAIMAVGYIAAQLDRLASAVINAKGVAQLSVCLCEENEDHIIAATVWALGQIGKHSSEHAKSLALTNVFPKMVELYCSPTSSEDLRQKAKQSLKQALQKCTHLHALESLLHETPLPILKYILRQFSKVLPHDSRARRLFVTTGGLRKVQQLVAEEGTPLHDYISIINLCFPEEIVSYYSPTYPASLLQRLEHFEPKIPAETLLADRRPSEDCDATGDIPPPPHLTPPKHEYGETPPPALPYEFSEGDTEYYEGNVSEEEGREENGVSEDALSDTSRPSFGVCDDVIKNASNKNRFTVERRETSSAAAAENAIPRLEVDKIKAASDVLTRNPK